MGKFLLLSSCFCSPAREGVEARPYGFSGPGCRKRIHQAASIKVVGAAHEPPEPTAENHTNTAIMAKTFYSVNNYLTVGPGMPGPYN
jgi:hypothetical protein